MSRYKTIYSINGVIQGNIASSNKNGLMSLSDKSKLDNIPEVLPQASETEIGGIKVGAGLGITDGLLSVNSAPSSSMPISTNNIIGGIKVGPGLKISNDILTYSGMIGTTSGNWKGPWIDNSVIDNVHMVIGTIDPVFYDSTNDKVPLFINRSKSVTITDYYFSSTEHYIGDNTYTVTDNLYGMSASRSVGIKCRKYIWTESGIVYTSDSRIKKNIVEINDNQSLKTLKNIKCFSYNYKDHVDKSSKLQIGFIAQQVNEHFPVSINIKKSIIPSHMKLLENVIWQTDGNINKLYSDEFQDVSGIKYRFLVADNEEDNAIPIELFGQSDNCFYFKKKWNLVFCYGKNIDDLHTIDKEKLFALNFSATQEIDRIQQQQIVDISQNKFEYSNTKNKIDLIKLENIELKTELNTIKLQNQGLIQRIESIKKRLQDANL